MNIRTLMTVSSFVLLAGMAQADDTRQPMPYRYGTPLAVHKVVSLTEPSTPYCEVVTAEMKYIDKTGLPRDMSYLKLSDACGYD